MCALRSVHELLGGPVAAVRAEDSNAQRDPEDATELPHRGVDPRRRPDVAEPRAPKPVS